MRTANLQNTEDRSQKTEVRRAGSVSDRVRHNTRYEMPFRRLLLILAAFSSLALSGCAGMFGYSDESLFPENVKSVRLEMFENQTFRRGTEYELSDALAKRIESDTPYKIVTSSDRADTVISGRITAIDNLGLSRERELGGVLEQELRIVAVVDWKNLKTGELLIEHESVTASASYTTLQNQDFRYASALAANKLAAKIVELMETEW
jgi:hypothetical protein